VIAISKARPGNNPQQHRGREHATRKPALLHSAKLHHVKLLMRGNFASRDPRSNATAKQKKPGAAGLSDENLFRSVHFASLAI
jgi:hypothetical protein